MQERFGDQVAVERRGFPLRPAPDPTARFRGTYREASWARAAAGSAADGVTYRMWDREDYPAWSLPALEAARCAAAQGPEVFERVHFALFEAFFAQGRNIAVRDELLGVVREAGVDEARFLRDFDGGRFRDDILREYDEAHQRYGITAIPTVIFGAGGRGEPPPRDQVQITGAVPRAEYEHVLTSRFGLRPVGGPA